MSIKPRKFLLLFLMLVSARLCADDAEYSDELENHQRSGFFGISDRPSPALQNQSNDSQQDYLNGYDPNSMANFLIPMQPQRTSTPVVVDQDFIYENASDEYLIYGIQDE